ncbi:hypothetical protein HDE_09029 [Halotydeus destructor]|nr:hypothetical protein HDE_09029 [Halotydeus destructor]
MCPPKQFYFEECPEVEGPHPELVPFPLDVAPLAEEEEEFHSDDESLPSYSSNPGSQSSDDESVSMAWDEEPQDDIEEDDIFQQIFNHTTAPFYLIKSQEDEEEFEQFRNRASGELTFMQILSFYENSGEDSFFGPYSPLLMATAGFAFYRSCRVEDASFYMCPGCKLWCRLGPNTQRIQPDNYHALLQPSCRYYLE